MIRDVLHSIWFMVSLYRLHGNETDANVEKTKAAAVRCGPIGNKLLQFLVSNNGLFNSELRHKFDDVFEDCTIHSFAETCEMYREDFGRDMREDFETDANAPVVGSGTIGQVYKLRHKKLGVDVAVKVKHPGVDERALSFAASLKRAIWFLKKIMVVPYSYLLLEFLNNIHTQLDYHKEAENTRIVWNSFKNEPHIIIPEIHDVSRRFIVMSYHEGVPFHEIKDENMRKFISIDLYFFIISSVVNYDKLHCDLHIGNWKVAQENNGDYKLIIYDFGLTSSSGNLELNKNIVMTIFNDSLLELGKVIIQDWENQPLWPELEDYINTIAHVTVSNFADKYTSIFRKALIIGIPFDACAIRSMQGMILCLEVVNHTRTRLSKALGKEGNCKEVTLCYNLGVLQKIRKYKDLAQSLQSWVDEDPNIRAVYENWLENTYGHKNGSIFVDITIDGLVI